MTPVIEVEVHNSLRSFLRSHSEPYWPHHLTMARLVARALRLGRSALLQTGFPPDGYYQRYRVSYLLPVLMWPTRAVLVAPASLQEHLRRVEIPRLQQWLETDKPIETYPGPADFEGLLLAEPELWLADRLAGGSQFLCGVPTIIDGIDDWEVSTRSCLTACLQPGNWNELMQWLPEQAELIRDVRVQLTRTLFRHPPNPYECYLLAKSEQEILQHFWERVGEGTKQLTPPLAEAWMNFWHRWETGGHLRWAEIARSQGSFSLYCAPLEVGPTLERIWSEQPVVLIGQAVDLEAKAPIYRQSVGLPDVTCVKFSPDRNSELIRLYVPERLPMPNTPQFQPALTQEVRTLLCMSASVPGLTVILIGDVPLKAQLGTILASEFGSRVQVEKTELAENGILVTGWEFWREKQGELPAPHLLAIATLPIPSMENPLVAARVAHYKEQRQDWFRLYLLPTALNELERAIAPVRERLGVVALLDSRVLHRSYGQQVFAALSPLARIDYLDTTWLVQA